MRIDIDGIADARLASATPEDCPELLVLQRCCWMREAIVNDSLAIPALHESLEDVQEWTKTWSVWVVRKGPRLIAAMRATLDGAAWDIGRIMVVPDLEGRGLGRWLLAYAENQAPAGAHRFKLFTGVKSARNIRMYERAGYRITGTGNGAAFLVKDIPG
ncbi:tRNA (guanine-N1)-methyltransferase [Actinosynnema sp. ALI-1.44]|uniref:GNAT family N-acetyltransferase n=1 Tax=Actinosynnema sp. ALI-1.44 TaxID=1933779 RepID=UPI00097BF715|nr:GNAT family N-acetyltransferase [Actinosynnema sp. ALI-1.44]ONI83179.1 tRNA (guanine-N1)-methyltransferase [Actinosynnema sp. ALI-1.44]